MKIVDKLVPDRLKYKVEDDYAVILNQTNIGENNNKFYIIQLLINNEDNNYYIWTRWGRVGENGKSNLDKFEGLSLSISEFEKKFKSKTGNMWINLKSFESKEGKYTVVDVEEKEGATVDDSAPMGKLTEAQIVKGQLVLKDIEKALECENKELDNEIKEDKLKKTKKQKEIEIETKEETQEQELQEQKEEKPKKKTKKLKETEIKEENSQDSLTLLSSKFYTLIPVVTGRKKPPPITTIDMLREKEELLKFYLRMGFEEVDDKEKNLSPISGIMDLELAKTLALAIGKVCCMSDVKSSVNKGNELAKKNVGNPTIQMDGELYGAILLYTSNAIYKELNQVLRNENRTGVKKYFNYLRMLFEALNRMQKKEMTLWRGISVDLSKQYKVGQTVTWWGISSCTSAKSVAENFMHSCGGDCSLLTIDTKTATDISEMSYYSSEKESLLAPGTQLLVKSIEKKGKIAHIHLEEIGRIIS